MLTAVIHIDSCYIHSRSSLPSRVAAHLPWYSWWGPLGWTCPRTWWKHHGYT